MRQRQQVIRRNMKMDCHLTTQFFSAFVEAVQKLCQDSVDFDHSVEVSGYVCLEIDSSKKERYVISELIQSTGSIVSESFCSKVFRTVRKPHATKCVQTEGSNSGVKPDGQAAAYTRNKDLILDQTSHGVSQLFSQLSPSCMIPTSSPKTTVSPLTPSDSLTGRSFVQNSLENTSIHSRWPVRVPESVFTSTHPISKSSDILPSPQHSLLRSKYPNSFGSLKHEKGRRDHSMRRKNVPVRRKSVNNNCDSYMETVNSTDTSNSYSYSEEGRHWSPMLSPVKAHNTLPSSSPPVTPPDTKKDDNSIFTQMSSDSSHQLSCSVGPKRDSEEEQTSNAHFSSHESAVDLSIVKVECQEIMQCEEENGGGEKLNQGEKRTCEQLALKTEKKGRKSPSANQKSDSEDLIPTVPKRPDFHGKNLATSSSPSKVQQQPLEITMQTSNFGQMSEEDTDLQNNDEEYLDFAYESGNSCDETFDKADMQESFLGTNLANVNADGDQYMESENKNTIRKTVAHVKLFQNYLKSIGEDREFYTIPASILDQQLGSFLVSIKKDNGEDYEPTYLRNIQSSLERYLRSMGYTHSITKHPAFQNSRYLLKCKQDMLVQQGKGNPNRTAPITAHDVNILYAKGQLGCESADALLNTLWFSNTVHFGIKSTKDHHSLKWDDVVYGQAEDGHEFIEYVGYSSKYRGTSTPLRVYAQYDYPARCPVTLYKMYAKNRPQDFCRTDDPFYLAVNYFRTPKDAWYKRQQIGLNRMGSMLKRMALGAGFPQEKRLTNLSAHKHGVTQNTSSSFVADNILSALG